MTALRGKPVVGGRGEGRALVTRRPINFTASFMNLLPRRRAEVRDRHHDLFGKSIARTVLVFPACIGSTYTGMVITQLVQGGVGPAALVVQDADPLLVSGAVMAKVWFDRRVPVVECRGEDLFEKISTGDHVVVDGDSGAIHVGA
jgi:predicted aconitase with swiveling domain